MSNKPFKPGRTAMLSAVAGSSVSATIEDGYFSIRLYNAGPGTAFFRYGSGLVTATNADQPLPPGYLEFQTKGNTNAIAVTSDSSCTFYATPGEFGS